MEYLDVPAAIPATAESEVFRPSFISSHKNGSAQVDFTVFPEAAKAKIRRHYVLPDQDHRRAGGKDYAGSQSAEQFP